MKLRGLDPFYALRRLALKLVWDGPRLPPVVARHLFDFGMGQKGRKL